MKWLSITIILFALVGCCKPVQEKKFSLVEQQNKTWTEWLWKLCEAKEQLK